MLSKVTIFALSVIFFSVPCESQTPARKCPGNFPMPINVRLNDCEELPCIVTRGTIADMNIQFVATKDDMYYLEADVRATVLGIVIPYPLSNDSGNVCMNLLYGAYCPLYASEDVTYHIDFPLENTIPEVNVKVEIKLVDKQKEVVTCCIIDLKVRKPKPSNNLQ